MSWIGGTQQYLEPVLPSGSQLCDYMNTVGKTLTVGDVSCFVGELFLTPHVYV